jgi:hypothetical protein
LNHLLVNPLIVHVDYVLSCDRRHVNRTVDVTNDARDMATTSAGVAGPGVTGRPSWAEMSARLRASTSSRLAPMGAALTAGGVARWALDVERQPPAIKIGTMIAQNQLARFVLGNVVIEAAISRTDLAV